MYLAKHAFLYTFLTNVYIRINHSTSFYDLHTSPSNLKIDKKRCISHSAHTPLYLNLFFDRFNHPSSKSTHSAASKSILFRPPGHISSNSLQYREDAYRLWTPLLPIVDGHPQQHHHGDPRSSSERLLNQ